jgi:ParB family chromosome partitioning protein
MSDAYAHALSVGDLVVDRDLSVDERSFAVVVNTPPKTAAEWSLADGETVATDNPSYRDDEPVTVAVYVDDVRRTIPYWSPVGAMPMDALNDRGVNWYAFPDARLSRCGWVGPHTVPVECLEPSPYHRREFDVANNRQFLTEIQDRGYPDPAPLARVIDNGTVHLGGDEPPRLELINGHRRVWAAREFGFESIPVRGVYLGDERAARWFARHHLPGYSAAQTRAAVRELTDRLGDVGERIVSEHVATDAVVGGASS